MSRGEGNGAKPRMFMPWFIDVCMQTASCGECAEEPAKFKVVSEVFFVAKNPETTDHGPKSIGHGLTIAAVAAKVATPEVGTLPAKSGAMPENGISACFVGI